ncbi:MAG TPA: hypothetical protein VMA34_14690 [Terracidiphilus sp.]|nr:hypothetical protein [Terracidiphilus sp.]
MKRDWFNMRFGIDFAAVGLLAVCVGAALVVFHDIWFVAAGAPPAMWLYDEVLSYLAAAAAAIFSVACFFVFRRGFPKYVAIVLAVSFASYVAQPLLPLHSYRQAAVLCTGRTLGLSSLPLLAWKYILDRRAGKVAR